MSGTSSSKGGSGSSGSISASFLGLKAELERSKASSSSTSSSSSKRKSSQADDLDSRKAKKKLASTFLDTSSSKSSKHRAVPSSSGGVVKGKNSSKKSSSATDNSSKDPSASQLDRIHANMERKARIYDQLQAGKYAGFTSAELKEGSIDWERKRTEPRPDSPRSRSPSPAPRAAGEIEDEPEIEWEDEFGRTRRSRLSSVPREFLPAEYGGDLALAASDEDQDNAIYGPATSFPVYNPDLHRSRTMHEKPVEKHFDPDFDRRHRGAGFYRFSDKETERQLQLDQLAELRRETERRRQGVHGERREV
ncbi:hypothetical protein EX895_005694 [Sporisorium graminicola]|uniref:Uncharacterized protein n=1 Tax=Sporisorium graminicola TaxID=280036 RepID=A0A4U7KRB9_9BASI|nr:hypothetical protein EX895_005694 [Sporisorium graminicola]TKY85532.1 hypothetical protein EX895_005694 [Sporisorium graminicola]